LGDELQKSRNKMKQQILVVLFCLFLGAQTGVCAQEQSGADDWNPPSAGPITTWTAPLCGKGEFVVQPFIFYNRTRGSFNSEGHYDALPDGEKKSQVQQQFFAQYGITDRLEIDGQMVYQENFATKDGIKAHSQGLGDSYFFTRYCFLEEKEWVPHITGLFQLKMPTGKYQHADEDKNETDLMGTGSWDPGLGINLTKRLKPFIVHADMAYSFPQKVKIDDVETRYANYLNWDFGVEYFLPKGFNLMLEFNGFTQGDTKENGDKTPASDAQSFAFAPGIGWSNDKIQALVAYQRILLGTGTDANDSVVLTFVYTF